MNQQEVNQNKVLKYTLLQTISTIATPIIAVASLILSIISINISKGTFEKEAGFSCVITDESLTSLSGPLYHQSLINLNLSNQSKYAESYNIRVESGGFGLCFKIDCDKYSNSLTFIENKIISPGDYFNDTFFIIHPRTLTGPAYLKVYQNDEVLAQFNYIYYPHNKCYVVSD